MAGRKSSAEEVGERIRDLRLALEMSQKQLAEPRYTPSYVSTIESGKRRPSRRALEHFAKKLGVDPEELLTGRPPGLEARLRIQLEEARIAVSGGQIDSAERLYRRIEDEAARFGLVRLQAAALLGRSACADARGEMEKCADLAETAESVLQGESDLARVDAIVGHARALQIAGELHHAAYRLESLLEALERQGLREPEALLKIRGRLCRIYFELGLYKRANTFAAEALRLARVAVEDEGVAHMYYQVSRVLAADGRFHEAMDSVGKAEAIYRRLGLLTEVGAAYLAKGFHLLRHGDYDRAREALQEALRISEQVNSPVDIALTLDELARIHRIAGEFEEAIPMLERSYELLPADLLAERAIVQRELGLCRQGSGDLVSAEDHLRRAIELFERCERSVEVAATHRVLGDLLLEKGEEQAGYASFRTGILALEKAL